MDLNSRLNNNNQTESTDTHEEKQIKKFLLLRVPAKIENSDKAIELLGGKEKIMSKFVKHEDIDLNLFYKKINLEKCLSNDMLIKRKRMRNKKK